MAPNKQTKKLSDEALEGFYKKIKSVKHIVTPSGRFILCEIKSENGTVFAGLTRMPPPDNMGSNIICPERIDAAKDRAFSAAFVQLAESEAYLNVEKCFQMGLNTNCLYVTPKKRG